MENILKEFAALNRIPRPSGHEENVAAYLEQRGAAMGFEVIRDPYLNVIFEVPATPGRENAPTVILQAHMDMVCVGDSSYDPLTDAIETLIDGNAMKAKATSLGADDGIGVALILDLLASNTPHGPLRVIFTADEEQGMTGASALDPKYLQGAYLINLDWEDLRSLCIGCAGFLTMEYHKTAPKTQAKGGAVAFTVQGLKGGHSGTEIGENRG
ncbi:MAG: M20/M25/M40 family metallo-hydrolase, partial [Bacillota bacterium]|nr:M20/M25/M40 family metallo-hydrolase [Bacillota bacterium]